MPDLSVVICTRDRAESLRTTLEHLARNELGDLDLDVLVVNNGSRDGTKDVVESLRGRLAVRYLHEATPGKSHALNCALGKGHFAPIVAFLDDDMSPGESWCLGVVALCKRWPDCDLFSASSYVIWPEEDVPQWAHRRAIQLWAFSVIEYDQERVFRPGEFPTGGHFWIRSRAIGKRRFPNLWATEPHFVLGMFEDGHAGIAAPEPRCGHRIQPGLLHVDTLMARANRLGRELPHVRLPYPRTVPQARLASRHPVLWRLLCAANLGRWSLVYSTSILRRRNDRIATSLLARVGIANNLESLRYT